MKELLYWGVGLIARIHDKILQLNNAFEMNFSDKQLHFLIIGLLGMAMIFVVYPLFKYLAKHDHEMVIAWIYVFTVIIVITFAIEIGQRLTGTGTMEFADVVAGMGGFFAVTAVIVTLHLLLWIVRSIVKTVRRAGRQRL